ncbi:LOW QUALITY PROTEIN: uncharacterized protein LOC122618215 [Drosophila teissieri]|uniref:LOW QUALITY PROTEIN: uncharacterized protein LOC122618215 n=1 Tax=Drosophila teissieri TaxID=7243 RepID=UPI001CBA5573|nr:LOW QUALITY PROTEIN: uncharacterized protein LOC122618215 [Drosophila teissieri]
MEKCRRRDLDSDPESQSDDGTIGVGGTGSGSGSGRVLGIGHSHVCRFMQHFSNYIRVGRHYNGNYTQEPQNMPVGGWPRSLWQWGRGSVCATPTGILAFWHSGLLSFGHFGIPTALSSSRGAAT